MKVTVEVDSEAIEEAMKATGALSKEDAVYIALQSISKADWIKEFSIVGPFPPPEEWKGALFPGYDPKGSNSPTAAASFNAPTYEAAATAVAS